MKIEISSKKEKKLYSTQKDMSKNVIKMVCCSNYFHFSSTMAHILSFLLPSSGNSTIIPYVSVVSPAWMILPRMDLIFHPQHLQHHKQQKPSNHHLCLEPMQYLPCINKKYYNQHQEKKTQHLYTFNENGLWDGIILLVSFLLWILRQSFVSWSDYGFLQFYHV